jgi:PIN domain nuclease of toxin-antitoxin system
MRLLLDSNVLLWSIFERHKLTPSTKLLIEDDANELYVSRTSLWEISAKASSGRLPLVGISIAYIIEQVRQTGLIVLELENRYILRAESLPFHHADPFDRILVAHAIEDSLTVLTADRDIPKYDAAVIWK